jgi:pSer/pThr/pTyr-binding forkhead associated (FHA) protein
MPLIRCQKCGQGYDVPGVVAVRLPNSIATCTSCGEWLSGSKAALLARLLNPSEIKEIDLSPYRVEEASSAPASAPAAAPAPPGKPRSVRIIARGATESVNTVFTIGEHPLWIGRKGCHVELSEAELSIHHCSISLHGDDLVLRDGGSHMGTFLDGQQVSEAVVGDGVHLVRVGSALISIEPTEERGTMVEPVAFDSGEVSDESDIFRRLIARDEANHGRPVLVCVEGPLSGQEFEIPITGLIVGREGHVRVPDEFLSRRHFEVVPDPDGSIRVRDLGSRNGTFLNTLPATDTKVHKGDEISAGVNRFRIELRG